MNSYADRKLWQKMGPIYTKAETVQLQKLKNAIDFFNESLAKRSAAGKMPAKEQQLRVDPADDKAYPLDSFLDYYGQDEGKGRWATAAQQPACTGGDSGHDFMRANIEACVTCGPT